MSGIARADPWHALRVHTTARIALGRSGASLPTGELLSLGLAHARARDAVHLPFDAAAFRSQLGAAGFDSVEVSSAAPDRAAYLRRPDLGRRLSEPSATQLAERRAAPCDLLCVIGDGLSAAAVHAHALPLIVALHERLEACALRWGPLIVAHQARVALGDEIGEAMHAGLVLMLVGERPGLSSPDSLGAYLTFGPRLGRNDAQRNCVSNIRPEGLEVQAAARRIAWLILAARAHGATGVSLKDESEQPALQSNDIPLGR
jgi:ethanolamine ammonia-lyase small subunit